jgi:hypothetical protein
MNQTSKMPENYFFIFRVTQDSLFLIEPLAPFFNPKSILTTPNSTRMPLKFSCQTTQKPSAEQQKLA